jgi:transposase-like protein
MKRQRRQYSADWKDKVALEAIKGQLTIQEIASHHEVHRTLVTHWKKQLLEGAAEILSNTERVAADADEELKTELYRRVGKLQVEVDWLRKVQTFALEERRRWIEPEGESLSGG